MYSGEERLINNGQEMPFSMLNFWQWGYSNLLHNMHRGKIAEYIVKCALEQGGINTNREDGTGIEPWDLDGPQIPSQNNRQARVEVKSAAFVQIWEIKHPDRSNFTIAPAVMPDETGDYNEGAPRQRNNDVYVFTVYTATDKEQNILDLSLWEFYVLPTYRLEADKRLCNQKTISLKAVRKLCDALTYDQLCDAIKDACNGIPADFKSKEFPSLSLKN